MSTPTIPSEVGALHDSTEIAARCSDTSQHLPERTSLQLRPAASFLDAELWQKLADKYLSRYSFPTGSTPCTPEAMTKWLSRLDLTERQWLKVGNYRDLADFANLNPTMPLVAWLGLALELKHDVEGSRK